MTLETIMTMAPIVIAAASAIAATTPTPKDDGVMAMLYKIIDLLALNFGYAKENGDDK